MASPLSALLKMSRFALGKMPAGGVEKAEHLMAALTEYLGGMGVPEEALARMQGLGKSLFRKGEGVPASVKALAGSVENSEKIQEALQLARGAWRGLDKKTLHTQWGTVLKAMGESGMSPQVLSQLKRLGPEKVAELGAGQTLSAFDRLGPDPFISQMYKKLLNKPTTTKGQWKALRAALGPILEEVAPGTRKALTEAGLPGFTGTARMGRAAAGTLGHSGAGTAAIVGLPTLFEGYKLSNRPSPQQARQTAIEGFMALGGSSSSQVLGQIVNQQEQAARRQIVLQQADPELFTRVLGVLSGGPQGRGILTESERQIGRATQGVSARRPDKDVKFLLDQLMTEASGQY